jgi:iron complex transport system ATP-binding protein
LDIPGGEFVGIIGPNGSGKTTLLRSVSRVLKPRAGVVFIGGRDVFETPARDMAREVGVVPQDTIPAFDFTALEIVLMGRSPHLGRFQVEGSGDIAIAEEAMRWTGTFDLAKRQFAALSGGERQRVVIARALAQEPRVILLDEPTSHLDINYQFEILNLIRRLNRERGITVVAVLHDLNLSAQYCDRLVMIGGGKIQALGAPEAVLTSENVKRVYGADVWVRKHPTSGRPYVIAGVDRPIDDTETGGFDRRAKVHVICGGGTGAPIFALLLKRGFAVTSGVLNDGDTDQEAAEALGLRYVSAPPFTAISDEAVEENTRMAADADIVVVSDMPYGAWNLPNLRTAVSVADSGGKLVLLRPETIRQRDFTGGDAMDVIEALLPRVQSASTLDELGSIVEKASAE